MSDTLLLNADGQPLNYLPLSVIDWQEAIRYMVLEKATVLEFYDSWTVSSPTWSTLVPSILILNEYSKPKQTVRFSRSNVYLRDRLICCYCLKNLEKKECTLDHVLPLSKGGKTNFENTVTACNSCNSYKGNNHKILPKIKPYKPTYYDLVNKRKKLPYNIRHSSWNDFLQNM